MSDPYINLTENQLRLLLENSDIVLDMLNEADRKDGDLITIDFGDEGDDIFETVTVELDDFWGPPPGASNDEQY